ncbi:DNA repair protein RadA [Corynebacterium diphtheriae]|uniref:DNA repair protein RadA n=1 Tax=Corynebacterium diphtheriae TaxID=1717 RepID=UPI00086F4048|nr:DNA repair protein RadA [Corynebacterium diphtheriae]MBG9221886.1 DNA repair protein RadA [Corynebacterium diphtheriae bv. mitis]MBG9301265.1 DNA repair protein RadA [Corynebacterium diphtheriae bv. mitis]MBN4651393.1 DNA repair protein RadA [Corynebacterium diphtheriae bv. mitis]MBN4653461.1 DNA repair protein RadA [Corynebacterium diphtheriae bv. mitis]ODS17207.1 DNA repair protein RadA [Corynebacterium diphtheriae]
MAKKARSSHICSECGYTSPKWLGRCPDCGAWGTFQEHQVTTSSAALSVSAKPIGLTPTSPAQSITRIDATRSSTQSTGIGELDRVLGSGIVPGSVVLLAGEPGVGKSTLLLEVASKWAQQKQGSSNRTALYITAEESAGQVRMRAERTGALQDSLYLAAESNLDIVFGHVEQIKPSLLIIDSVQTMQASGVEGVAGGVAQSRAVTAAITSLAKTTGIPCLLVGHVTKDGNVAGPRVLEHLVDVVLNFEGDRHSSLRMLRGIKNRFGATDEVGCFEQHSDGIREVPDPSGLFLSHHGSTPDGTAVTVAMDGVRPIVAEVQALVVPTEAKNPRRAVTGLDPTRVPMVLAVLAARAGKRTHSSEVYVATVGGMKVGEPATDLAIALATASALNKKAIAEKTVVLGEVGLAGEIRRVPNIQRRLMEAQRLGYKRAIIPVSDPSETKVAGIKVIQVSDIREALDVAMG